MTWIVGLCSSSVSLRGENVACRQLTGVEAVWLDHVVAANLRPRVMVSQPSIPDSSRNTGLQFDDDPQACRFDLVERGAVVRVLGSAVSEGLRLPSRHLLADRAVSTTGNPASSATRLIVEPVDLTARTVIGCSESY